MKVLLTGGAGYIGSAVASRMIDAGVQPVILDDLSTGREDFTRGRVFYRGDIADGELIDRVLRDHPDIRIMVHCAARIVVPESIENPLLYYRENVGKTIELLGHVTRNGLARVLFSSSAAIYGPAEDFSVDEDSPISPTSPYAESKAMVERILQGCAAAGALRALSLRYFNPIGADPSLRTGLQLPNPTHALGRMIHAWETDEPFPLTGDDWPTRDGTGIRDYIHVWDLAAAHLRAVQAFDEIVAGSTVSGYRVLNLGTGTGTTVRELLDAFSAVAGRPVPHAVLPRRPGDVAGAYASSGLARQVLGWSPEFTLQDAVRHALAWRAQDTSPRPPAADLSTADQSTAGLSTAGQSTADQSTAGLSTADQSTAGAPS